MNKNPERTGVFGAAVTVAPLVVAVWLVWPFARNTMIRRAGKFLPGRP